MAKEELIINKSETITTTASKISETCFQQRTFISIINTSTGGQTINVAIGEEAVAGSGIQLYPGGYYTESIEAGFKPTNKLITAISSAAGGTLAIQERILMDTLF